MTNSNKHAPTRGSAAPWDIVFRHLTLGYGKRIVLEDINATLPAGKITVILGGSGGGKSTILRHLAGLATPMAGEISIGGQNLFQLDKKDFRRLRRRMGVLFQDGALLGALTLAQNVTLPLSQHLPLSSKLLAEAADRVLGMVDLGGFGDYYPNQLSGGMRKRAGLARAIVAEPLILLCDEPTSGLDPITASRMDELLLTLHRQYPDMTLVVVSHDLASLRRIADYVLVLREGRAIFAGPADELSSSVDPYLRRFLNRAPGHVNVDMTRPPNPAIRNALERWFNS